MITLSQTLRERRLAVLAEALDSGSRGGRLMLYGAPQPLPGDAPAGADLLAELGLPQPCTASLSGGILRLAEIPEALCRQSGTPAWARLTNGDGRWLADLDVGTPDSGAAVMIATTTLQAGGTIQVTLAEWVE